MPRNTNERFVVKCKFKTICKDKNFHKEICKLVSKYNEILFHSYHFIRAFVLYCFNNNLLVPELNEERVKFCIKAIVSNRGGKDTKDLEFKEEIKNFYETEYSFLRKIEASCLTQSIAYMARDIHTAYSNLLELSYPKMLCKLFSCSLPSEMKKQEKRYLSNKLKAIVMMGNEPDEKDELLCALYKYYKNYIFPEKINIHLDLKINTFSYLIFALTINYLLEEKGVTPYQVLSLKRSLIPSYIPLDTTILIHLFTKKSYQQNNVKLYENEIWREYFNLDLKLFKKKKFSYFLETDGVGVSLVFEKNIPKKKGKNSSYLEASKDLKTRKVVGIDVGKHNLLYMTDESPKGQDKTLRYTELQRRKECYFQRSNEIIKKITEKVKKQENKPQKGKTLVYDDFIDYIKEKSKLYWKHRNFYEKQVFRNLKFRRYTKTQQSEVNLLNRIKETFGNSKEIVLGIGDWNEGSAMKNNRPTKGIGFRKLLARRFQIGLVNEFRTSKLCFKCYQPLEDYKVLTKQQGKKVWRLKVCSQCSKSNKRVYLNRDLNGAKNIAMLTRCALEDVKRPLPFTKGAIIAL